MAAGTERPGKARTGGAGWRDALARQAFALAIGAAGGLVFSRLDLPLAWMLGAMVATTAAALAGLPLAVGGWLRQPMIAVLGVMLGSAFTPDIVDQLGRWAAGFGLMTAYVLCGTGLLYVYFRRAARLDPVTAYFSASPGGLNAMVIMGEALGGDVRVISVVHATRVLIVVLSIPLAFRWIGGLDVPGLPPGARLAGLGLDDAVVLTACGVLGYGAGVLLRLRTSQLIGPMVLSAAAHLAGLTRSQPPAELLAAAQMVIGCAVGCRFAGASLARIGRTLRLAAGSTLMLLALTALFSVSFSALVGFNPAGLVLALSPGGLAEMSLVALALGVDTAFVSTMQIARIGIIVLGAPPLFRLVERRARRRARQGDRNR